MEFKGTKGKWRVFDDYIQDEYGGLIADCFPTSEEDRANALLISKAPEMLEYLLDAVNEHKNGVGVSEGWFKAVEKLIKEATELQ